MRRIALLLLSCLLINSITTVSASSSHDLPLEWLDNNQNTYGDTIRVIVQANNNNDLLKLKHLLKSWKDVKIRNEYDTVFNGLSLEIKESDYYKLSVLKEVQRVSRSKVYYPLMASSKLLTQSIIASEKYHNKGEGMVISVIDSGLDVTHKDFQNLTNPQLAKIQNITPFGGENTDTHFNIKVPYGYNFADHSYRIKGYESNHGIHVAGISGANASDSDVEAKTGIDGVASEAQILMMGVFSNNPDIKGAQEDDIIAAIEKSIEMKADVINMSLGTRNGFLDDLDPTARAIEKATNNGILVVAAAGNDTAAFSNQDGPFPQNIGGRIDFGIVGSPSTSRYALSVASFENTHLFNKTFSFNDSTKNVSFGYTLARGNFTNEELDVVAVGLGEEDDYNGVDVEGKIVLVQRGKITFVEKVNRAHQHNARGIMIYNNQEGTIGMALDGTPEDYLVLATTKEAGAALVETLKTNPNTKITLSDELLQSPNPLDGKMSGFTSIGTTSDLDFKPEITGIGGNVYSTDNDNNYVMMNGTSMASPHVAGASALVFSQAKKDIEGVENYAIFTKKTMMNTAQILKNHLLDDIPYSARRQGSGLVQTKDAMDNRVILSSENGDGEASIALRDFTGTKSFNVHMKNYGKSNLNFRLEPTQVYTTVTEDDVVKEKQSLATVSSDTNEISLAPNEEKIINFTIDTNGVDQEYVEGFIQFKSLQNNQPDVHIPFLGFAGDWNAENMFDEVDVQENTKETFYSDTKLISMIKDPLNFLDSGRLFDLGKPFNSNEKPNMANYAFSPNNDGFADIVIPQIALLRNASELKFNILDENKNLLRTIGIAENARKQSLKDYMNRVNSNNKFKTHPYIEGSWDGKLYDPTTGSDKVAADGQYYLEIEGKLAPHRPAQKLTFDIKVDTKKPVINVIPVGDKEYEVTNEGRKIRYEVTDDSGVMTTYAKVNNKRIEATLVDGVYEVILPFNQEMGEDVALIANDFALNETRTMVKKVLGNSLQLTNWKPIISKKITLLGQDVSGSTTNEATRFISFEFTNKKDGTLETSKDHAVKNGKITFASFNLKKQGKYNAKAIEKDQNKQILKTTDLGELIYDYYIPQIKDLNYHEKITDPTKQKRPLPELVAKKKDKYFEYAMLKNPDGTVTYTGKVSDNVFEPQELTLTIGLRTNVVPIKKDGSFKYVLKNPSRHFDFINVSQPSSSGSSSSGLIDSLDLAGKPLKKEKSLENTYVISKYIESSEPKPLPEYRLILNSKLRVGSANIDTKDAALTKVEKRDDKYFIKITGFTTQSSNKVYVEGELANKNQTTGGGLYFEKEVEIVQGINAFNVRVKQDDETLEDRQVRVIFDKDAPTVEITSLNDISTETKQITINNEPVDVTVLKTWLDEVDFAGVVADNGLGYVLAINDDTLVNVENPGKAGDNTRNFTKKITVDENSIVKVSVNDLSGNESVMYYTFMKIDKPVDKSVLLKNKLNKVVGDVVTVDDIVVANPDNAEITLGGDYDTSTVGEKLIRVTVKYDDKNIDYYYIHLNVVEPIVEPVDEPSDDNNTDDNNTEDINTSSNNNSYNPIDIARNLIENRDQTPQIPSNPISYSRNTVQNRNLTNNNNNNNNNNKSNETTTVVDNSEKSNDDKSKEEKPSEDKKEIKKDDKDSKSTSSNMKENNSNDNDHSFIEYVGMYAPYILIPIIVILGLILFILKRRNKN